MKLNYFLLMVLLSGCSVSRPSDSWWQELQDPILEELVTQARFQKETKAEIAQNYFELRGSQQQLRLIQKRIDQQSETLNLTQDLVRRGVASTADLNKKEAEESTLKAEWPVVEVQIAKRIHHLARLLDYDSEELCDYLADLYPLPQTPPLCLSLDLCCPKSAIEKEERENAIVSYQKEAERLNHLKGAYDSYQKALIFTQTLYNRGLTDLFALSDSAKSLYSAEELLLKSQVELLLNYVELYKVSSCE